MCLDSDCCVLMSMENEQTPPTFSHLSLVNGRKPIVRKYSPMKTFSLKPIRPVAGDGLRRALLFHPRSPSPNTKHVDFARNEQRSWHK